MSTDDQKTSMKLADGVVETIISLTASNVEGVSSVSSAGAGGILAKLSNRPDTTGIQTDLDEDGRMSISIHVEVNYGYVLPEVAENLRNAIAEALLMQLDINVSSVDIYIDAITFEQN